MRRGRKATSLLVRLYYTYNQYNNKMVSVMIEAHPINPKQCNFHIPYSIKFLNQYHNNFILIYIV